MKKYLLPAYFVVNLITFLLYGIDKGKAVSGKWRIKESTLILFGLCFGAVGQILGMKVFHHKTKKWYFVLSAIVGLILQVVVVYFVYARLGAALL